MRVWQRPDVAPCRLERRSIGVVVRSFPRGEARRLAQPTRTSCCGEGGAFLISDRMLPDGGGERTAVRQSQGSHIVAVDALA
jgi:hypothetical protein